MGKGKPVIFLHGFLLDTEGWYGFQLDQCQFQSIYLDLPGHGINKQVALAQQTIRAYAEWVHSVLSQLKIENYSLVGHSMGGYIGLELLKLNPKLEKLILFHSNHWADSEERKKNRDRVGKVVEKNARIFLSESIPFLFHEPEKYAKEVAEIIDRAAQMSPKQIIHAAQSMKNRPDMASVVQDFRDKCYFIQGEFDQVIDANEARKTWAGLSTHFYTIKQCGHMSHIEQPMMSTSLIQEILK